jgi:hypothetical protein
MLFLTIISALSLAFDAICIHLISSNDVMGNFEYITLSIQITALVYNIVTILSNFFLTCSITLKLLKFDLLLRLFFNVFYTVFIIKNEASFSIGFYILSYLNLIFTSTKLIIKTDETSPIKTSVHPQNTQLVEEYLKDSDDNCSICIEPLKNTNIYRTKCNHIFHIECMKNYVNSNSFTTVNCPNCRDVIITID